MKNINVFVSLHLSAYLVWGIEIIEIALQCCFHYKPKIVYIDIEQIWYMFHLAKLIYFKKIAWYALILSNLKQCHIKTELNPADFIEKLDSIVTPRAYDYLKNLNLDETEPKKKRNNREIEEKEEQDWTIQLQKAHFSRRKIKRQANT